MTSPHPLPTAPVAWPPTPPQPPTKPSHRKAWLTHGAVGVIALFLGAGISGSGDAQADGHPGAAPTVTVTKTAEAQAANPEPTVTVTATTTVTAKPPKPKGPATSVPGDGEYLVGTDMKAGTYRTAGPDEFGCYWERDKDSSGDFDSIIANDNLQGSGRVTVRKGEVFKTSGCQKWVKVG